MNAESQRQNVIQTNFDLRSGRQINTDKVVVPGFPNGLPNGVPEGVKIALASAQRGNIIYNRIIVTLPVWKWNYSQVEENIAGHLWTPMLQSLY